MPSKLFDMLAEDIGPRSQRCPTSPDKGTSTGLYLTRGHQRAERDGEQGYSAELFHYKGDYGTAILSREAVWCLYAHARITQASYKQLRWHATKSQRLLASHDCYMRTLQMVRYSYLQRRHYSPPSTPGHVIEAMSLALSLVQCLPPTAYVVPSPEDARGSKGTCIGAVVMSLTVVVKGAALFITPEAPR